MSAKPKRKPRKGSALQNHLGGMQRFRNRLADSGIPERLADDFIQHHTVLNYPKNAVIFRQESPSDLLSWVRNGVVATIYSTAEGARVLTRLVGPGEIFGHLSFTGAHGHLVHAFESRAHTNCQIAVVSHERVFRALETLEPVVLLRLLGYVSAAWAQTAQYWAGFLAMDYRRRLETIFVDLATRLGVVETHETRLDVDLGHRDLAEMIGCSRPMASQLVASMLRSRKIERRGRYYVLPNGSRRGTSRKT